MSVLRLFCLFVLLIPTGILQSTAVQATIWGTAIEYKNEKLQFYKYSDYITKTEVPVGSTTIENDGSFSLLVSFDATCEVFCYLGRFKAFIFVEPNCKYHIALPPRIEKTMADELNPFFTHEELSIGILNNPETELNYVISDFNNQFDSFVDDNFTVLYVSANIKAVDSLQKRLDSLYASINNPYFTNYKLYKYASLRNMVYERDRNWATRKYLLNKPLQYANPAYMHFFVQLWNKYFTASSLVEGGEELLEHVQYGKSPTRIKSFLKRNMALRNDTLAELVMLQGLADCLKDPEQYLEAPILLTLDSITLLSRIPEHVQIAKNLMRTTDKLKQGDMAPDFTLQSADGTALGLKKFKGRYVYLMFCRSENYSCLQDYRLIKDIENEHLDELSILTVSGDKTSSVFNDFLKENPEYSWSFVFDSARVISKKYQIRVEPSYLLLDPAGKIAMLPAPSPHEDFKTRFVQMIHWRNKVLEREKLKREQQIIHNNGKN